LIPYINKDKEGTVFSGHSPKLGIKSGYSLSDEAIAALQCGDTQALIDSHRRRFAGWSMMADGDDDDDSDDGDDSGDDSGDSGDGDDGGDDDGDDSSGDDDDKVSKADLEAALKRMKAADKRASEAEAKLKKQEDAKKDELTKATERAEELEEASKEKDATIASLRLENAFLTTNKHTWHKPGAALKLAQSEGYLEDVTDDDGIVDSKKMGSALDKLAKEHAYLVNTGSGGSGGSSGSSAGGRSGNGKDDKAQADADRRRAPALSRRSR
jgi:hypothetical protein